MSTPPRKDVLKALGEIAQNCRKISGLYRLDSRREVQALAPVILAQATLLDAVALLLDQEGEKW